MASQAQRTWREWTAVALAYLAATVILTWPITLHPASQTTFFHGDTLLNAYILAWDQHALLTAPWHVFSPNFFYPGRQMLCLSENMLAPALLTLPLAPFRNPILVCNVVFLGSFLASALLWRWVLRRWGLGGWAAWIGGLMFGFLPWKFGQIGHLQLLLGWWIPLVLLGVDGWLRGGGARWAILAGTALAAQFYTCVYLFYFTALFAVPFAAVGLALARPERRLWRGLAWRATLGGLLLALLLAPAYGPYADVRQLLGEETNALETLEARGAALADYLRPGGINLLYGRRSFVGPNLYADFPWEHLLWLGWLAVAASLTLPAAWQLARRRGAWGENEGVLGDRALMLLAGGLALGLLSLGPVLHFRRLPHGPLPWYGWLHAWLPGFDAIRVPARAGVMVGLTLSGLAALAIDGWLRWCRARWGRSAATALACLFVIAAAADLLNRPLPVGDNPDYARHRAVHAALARQPAGVALALPMDVEINYLTPLAAVEHFNPVVNGVSGYLPASSGMIFDLLRLGQWGERQIELLRWLRVRYLVLDHRRQGQSDSPVPANLPAQLEQAGLIERVWDMPDREITVFILKTGVTKAPEEKFSRMFSLNRSFGGRQPTMVAWIHYHAADWILEDRQRPLKIKIRGEDERGEEVWSQTLERRLPQFLLKQQVVGFPLRIDDALWRRTREVSIQVHFRGLDRKLKATYRHDGDED